MVRVQERSSGTNQLEKGKGAVVDVTCYMLAAEGYQMNEKLIQNGHHGVRRGLMRGRVW